MPFLRKDGEVAVYKKIKTASKAVKLKTNINIDGTMTFQESNYVVIGGSVIVAIDDS